MRTAFLTFILVGLIAITGCSREPGARPPSIAELTAMLQKDTEPDQQVLAIGWVKQLGTKAKSTQPQLIAALKSPHVHIRQNAALALSALGPDAAAEAVPALTALLNDPEPSVQQAAISSLGEFGPASASAIPAIEAVSQKSDGCKAPADNALKKIRS